MYNLRARWYNPTVGTFASIDPYAGDPMSPVSLHRYLYANASPNNYIDPRGEFTLVELNATVEILNILVSSERVGMGFASPRNTGVLTICSYRDSGGLTDGHSWLKYVSRDGKETTYGTFGNTQGSQHRVGLNYNSEVGFPPSVARSAQLFDYEENKLIIFINKIDALGSNAWHWYSPCSAFASDGWLEVTGEFLEDRNWYGISNPNTLADSIYRANGNDSYGKLR